MGEVGEKAAPPFTGGAAPWIFRRECGMLVYPIQGSSGGNHQFGGTIVLCMNQRAVAGAAAILLTLLILLPAGPATAAVEVISTEARLEFWALYGSNHGPCSLCYWLHETPDGVGFDFQQFIEAEDQCTISSWQLYCDQDGFQYAGGLVRPTEAFHDFMVCLEVTVQIQLHCTAPTLISAHRHATGIMDAALHRLSVTGPGDDVLELLGSDPLAQQGEAVLEPGDYLVSFTISGLETFVAPFDYGALVEVAWAETVGVEDCAWDRVKSLYR